MQLRELSVQSFYERAKYESLINLSFPVPKGASYFDDFPIWRLPSPNTIRIGAFDCETLIGVGGLRITHLKVGSKQYRIGILGSIATHPDHRRKGIASKIIEKLLEFADDKKLSGVFLWGSEFTLYERHGFRMAGIQARVLLKDLKDAAPSPNIFVKPAPASIVLPLRKQMSCGVLIETTDELWYQAHKNTEFCIAIENEKTIAYAAIGRGIDLPNLIHEWSGTPTGLSAIWSFLKSYSDELWVLFHPELHSESITAHPEKWLLEDLCMARFKDEDLESQENLIWFWGLDGA